MDTMTLARYCVLSPPEPVSLRKMVPVISISSWLADCIRRLTSMVCLSSMPIVLSTWWLARQDCAPVSVTRSMLAGWDKGGDLLIRWYAVWSMTAQSSMHGCDFDFPGCQPCLSSYRLFSHASPVSTSTAVMLNITSNTGLASDMAAFDSGGWALVGFGHFQRDTCKQSVHMVYSTVWPLLFFPNFTVSLLHMVQLIQMSLLPCWDFLYG